MDLKNNADLKTVAESFGINIDELFITKTFFTEDEITSTKLQLKNPIEATGDVVQGDIILFAEGVFEGSFRNPKFLGFRWIKAEVLKESYGGDKQQHTFTLKVLDSDGKNPLKINDIIKRKGRNIYRYKTKREHWKDEKKRDEIAQEKHQRGDAARSIRDIRRNNYE